MRLIPIIKQNFRVDHVREAAPSAVRAARSDWNYLVQRP